MKERRCRHRSFAGCSVQQWQQSQRLGGKGLIASLIVELARDNRVYELHATDPARLDKLVRELLGGRQCSDRIYRSAIDRESGLLIVTPGTGTPEAHAKVRRF